jgi:MoxR-like ATPase
MATLVKGTYLKAKTGEVITYDQFAFGIGQQDRLTLEESVIWHKDYLKSDKKDKADYAREWRVNYLMGNLGVSSKEADRILSLTKTKRTDDQQKAYMRANSKFSYHIVRPVPSGVSKQVKVTVDQVVELFEQLSKAEQAKFLRIIK